MASRIKVLVQNLERPDGKEPGPPVEYTTVAVFLAVRVGNEGIVEAIGSPGDVLSLFGSVVGAAIDTFGVSTVTAQFLDAIQNNPKGRVIYDNSTTRKA